MKALAARKRVEAQKREIFQLVNIMYGAQGIQELREIREEILKERQRQVYAQEEMRQQIAQGFLLVVLLGGFIALVALILS